jgi:RNA polymerase sigma-70 factor (ECF subfamily)
VPALFYATRADLLCRLGRNEEAAAAYATARARTANRAEQAFLDAGTPRPCDP